MEARESVCSNACCGRLNGDAPNATAGHSRCVRLAVGNGVRRVIANGHMRVRPEDSAGFWRSAGVPERAGTRPLNGFAVARQGASPVAEQSGQVAEKARPVRSESQAMLMVSRDIGPFIKKLSDRLHEWRERRSGRRALLSMSDHMLRDIGISRADAEAEWRKSFRR